jgi:hypothetical protein
VQVFACPLRNDSGEVLKELKASSHDLVGILLSNLLVIFVVLVMLGCTQENLFMIKKIFTYTEYNIADEGSSGCSVYLVWENALH